MERVGSASRAWKKTSGFCAVPRRTGWSGVSARARCVGERVLGQQARSARRRARPTLGSRARCGSRRRSAGTARAPPASRRARRRRSPGPPAGAARTAWPCRSARQAITSPWSPKIESACVARLRARRRADRTATARRRSRYRLGIISNRPCEAVNVRGQRAGLQRAMHRPAAPASDCISTTRGTVAPQVRAPAMRPLVGVLAHGRGRGDRVDRHHLAEAVGDGGRPPRWHRACARCSSRARQAGGQGRTSGLRAGTTPSPCKARSQRGPCHQACGNVTSGCGIAA